MPRVNLNNIFPVVFIPKDRALPVHTMYLPMNEPLTDSRA